MKYENAGDILPHKLLKELQKYVSGGVIYVPSSETKKSWGENSGARLYYKKRNGEIRDAFAGGESAEKLSEKYNLSTEAIRKILS